MTLFVDPIEALWFIVNATTLVITAIALFDARRDLALTRADPSNETRDARELTARGNVRREVLRAIVQILLISIVIPGLFTDRPITLSPPIIALILVPAVLLTSTIFDVRDRAKLGELLIGMVRAERETLALESSVQQDIALTRESIGHAQAAYSEANSVNEKIARLTELVGGKEDKP